MAGKENPYMYRCIFKLEVENEIYDSVELPFGFRNMRNEAGIRFLFEWRTY